MNKKIEKVEKKVEVKKEKTKKTSSFNFTDLGFIKNNARALDIRVLDKKNFLVSYVELKEGKVRLVLDYFEIKKNALRKENLFSTQFLPLNSELINDKKDNLSLKEKFTGIHQAGGKIEIVSDTNFLISIGDFNNEHLLVSDNNYFGKIISVDIKTKNIKIIAKGLRNPQGLTELKKNIYLSTEHGMVHGDEVNIILENNHYGWPYVTLGHPYGAHPKREMINGINNLNFGNHDNYTKPLFSFVPDIGIKDILIYPENKQFNRWSKDVLICSGKGLYRLRPNYINKTINNILYSEKIIKDPCRDMALSKSGYIFFNNLSYIIARKLYK